MAKFTVTHEINCDEATFWRLFFDRPFNEDLFRNGLKFIRYDILDQKETDAQIVRKVAGKPQVDMPGPIKKLFGDGFAYTEEGTFDKASKLWRWKMTPGSMPDKVRQEGTMRAEVIGPNKVRRVAELVAEAKIFAIGGMVEGFAEKSLKEGWDNSAKFMNQFIADGKHNK